MRLFSNSFCRLSGLLTGLFWSGAGWAQSPNIAGIMPPANAASASRTGAVTVTFTQPLTGGAASALKVFSKQRGGLRTVTTVAVANANTLTFTPPPALPFMPGETISGTVTTAAASTTGNLPRSRVFQFTAAVGATGTGAFQAPPTNPNPAVALNARAVAVGDLDGDGDLDFACSYEDASSNGFVSVQLNNGTGGFTAPAVGATIPVGVGNLIPIALVLGDVDGDGDLDVVTANHSGNTVSILLNDGSAHFTAPSVNPNPNVGNYASHVVLCDIDGDGDLDLLAAGGTPQAGVNVRLNNGAGSFTAPTSPAAEVLTNGSVSSVAAGDIDGDGDLDLVAANEFDNTVSVRLNDGSGIFTAPATMPNIAVGVHPCQVVLGDFDADGDLDFATANMNGTASVRLNNGTGGFTAGAMPELTLGRATSSVAASDVDGDGDLDLLASDLYDEVVRVRLNDGRGNFTYPSAFTGTVAVGTVPKSLVTGDIDGDGDVDLLAAVGGGVSVRLNYVPLIVTGTQPGANALAVARTSLVRATFNRPLASGASTLQVHSLLRGGLRTHTTPAVINGNALTYSPPITQPYQPGETVQCTITAAAVPSTGNLGHSRVTQFTAAVGGTGTGRFLLPPVAANATLNLGTRAIAGMASGDIDGDGDLDLLVGTGPNTVTIRLNNGQGIFAAPAVGATLTINSVFLPTLGDVDGDGDLDLLTGCNDAGGSSSVSISLNNGNGTFGPPAYEYIHGALSSIDLGDLDGNGTLDFVATQTGSSADYVSVRLNNGNGTFTDPYFGQGGVLMPYSTGGIRLGDIDRDGDLDFLVGCGFPGGGSTGLAFRFNDGFGRFNSSPDAPFIPVFSPTGFALGDLDGDGDLDLLSMDGSSGYTTVFLNNGTGLFTPRPANAALYSSNFAGLTLGDVDADGDLDVLVLAGTPRNTTYNGAVYERLNDGLGNFTMPSTASQAASVQVDKYPSGLAMVDIDGDGDLDVLTPGGIDVFYGGNAATVSVRLNGGTVLATASPRLFTPMSLYPNPATREVRVAGATIGTPLEVFDVMGRRVASTGVVTRETTPVLLPAGLAAGVYIVRSGSHSQRLTVQ